MAVRTPVRVTVDDERKIEVPAEALEQLGIGSGSTLLVEVRDGALVARLDPVEYVERMRGLGREIWEGVDPVEYVRGEREARTEEE